MRLLQGILLMMQNDMLLPISQCPDNNQKAQVLFTVGRKNLNFTPGKKKKVHSTPHLRLTALTYNSYKNPLP